MAESVIVPPMPKASIQKAVMRAVDGLALAPAARILDLSCGEGEIVGALAEKGYAVEGTHYRSDDYILRNPSPRLRTVPVHGGVDLTRPLPFPDASFDCVLATEVLEHLPSHVPIVSEVGRILRPRGHFIFTTPNIHCLSSRMQFLLTGTHELCGARLGWNVPRDDLYTTHFNPVYFPVFHTLLHHQGLHVKRLHLPFLPPWDALLLLLYPLLAAATALEIAHFRKRSPAGGRDLLRWMLDVRMLLSRQLVATAERDS